MPAAKAEERPALRNKLPDVLDGLEQALAAPGTEETLRAAEELRRAVEHGHERARIHGYSLEQVIGEYHTLRNVLFDVLEEDGHVLARPERDLIWDVLFLSIKSAAGAFTRVRDAEKETEREALSTSNVALARALGDKAAEARLKAQLLETVYERVEDYAIFSLDARGRITTWTKGAERMKQYAPADVLGHHYEMLYPEDGRARKEPEDHLEMAARLGRFRGEGLRRRKDGTHFLADVFITPMFEDGALVGFFKIVTDLTERNRVIQERDLTRTRVESLELESELRERFVYTLSHDLRSPLAAAQMSAQLIAREGCEVAAHADLARRTVLGIKRVDRMVSDLLDASRVKAGQPLPIDVEACDLGKLAREVHDGLSSLAGGRLVVDAPASVPGFWDPGGLTRVLENLVTNALKYGDPAGQVTIRVMEMSGRVLLDVHNLGSPLSMSEQESLFELFHRTRSAERGPAKGWGIGLALVRGITEAHGGIVKVKSLPSEGTTFTLDLPRDARAAATS